VLATLLALADPDRIPNQDAIAMSPTVGWLMVAAFVSIALMFILQSERWRRFWLTNEDPRPIGLFRIVFAFLCICNINDLFEYFVFLFSDEGVFLTDAARQHFAAAQLKGFGDGLGDDPHGFFDWAGVLEFLRGPKYSLLFFWDSPAAMWAQMIGFYTVTTLFMIGWRTRLMGVLSFALMNSFFLRNQLFWEGTEVVYRVFFFYLLLARSGHAYSVDNWLRTRKLQKQGLLSVRGGPGDGAGAPPSPEHPSGLQAIYRLIPAWPRNLMMLNLGVLYCYTGAVKNGHVWAKGDALYFALNMDHFHRFYPQEISSIPWVGLGLMRLATWITHWWEALFPFLIFGIITRWALDEKLEPLKGWRLWSVRACWLAFGLLCGAIVVYTLPVHYAPGKGKWPVWYVQQWTAAGWLGLMVALGGMWWALGNRPPKFTIRGHKFVLDREWFCKWVLGRRVWLTLGLMFHGNLLVLMNIGMFPPIMMSTYLFMLRGDEPGRILRFFARGLGRAFPSLPLPTGVRRGEPPIPAEDRTLPHHLRDGRRLPPALMLGMLALAVLGVALQATPIVPWLKEHVLGYETAAAAGGLHFAYTLLAILATLIIYTYVKGHRGTPRFAVRLAVLVALIAGYVYLMARVAPTQSAKDNLLLIKIGVNAALLLLVILSRVPAVRRVYARWGLTFDPHDNPRRPPDRPAVDPWSGHPIPPWSYGPIGRVLIGSLVIYHIVAIALWVLPEKDCLSSFRIRSRESFSTWVLATSTDQGWGMFAPNPPQHNVFMRVVVTDEDGEQWDLRTDVYAQERHPIPWVWNDRMRKMNRRIIGGEGGKGDWYQEWYARYLCREWALAHRGAPPQKVELYKVSYRMPPPELVIKQGWYSPERLLYQVGRESKQHTTKCASVEHGQLPNEIRERHGLPLLEDGVFKPRSAASKKKAWDKRYEPAKEPRKSTPRTPITPTAKKVEEKAEEPADQPQAEATPAPPVEGPKMND
jgi:hypothetical protein